VRALKSNHGQELIQVDPECNNVFIYKKPGHPHMHAAAEEFQSENQFHDTCKKVLDINGTHRRLATTPAEGKDGNKLDP
jgi:hypothetical protein